MTASTRYSFIGTVELFPQKGGWHYVAVPTDLSEPLMHLADRGLIAVHVTAGSSSWPTSLLPKGDSTHFIPLSAKVRNKQKLDTGDEVRVSFTLRGR